MGHYTLPWLISFSLGGIMHFAVSKTKDKAEKGNIMNFQPIHLNIFSRFGKLVISAVALGAAAGAILVAQESRSIDEVIVGKKNGSEQDISGIERLHQQDAAATLSDKADELAKLWDNDAVRIQPGRPAEVSKAVIYANDKLGSEQRQPKDTLWRDG